MTFKSLKELDTTESRSCALLFNFNNKDLMSIKSIFRLIGISDIIILKNENLNTVIKDILEDNLLNDSEDKINKLNTLREENNCNYLISIDGGINNETIEKVKDVDFIISGSFICMSDDYQEKINELR